MSFRKRKRPIITDRPCEFSIVNRKVGEEEYVSTEIVDNVDVLPPPSPTLDEMLNAGVSVRQVETDGILDSYDENDTPIADIEDKILNSKSHSKKSDK